MEFAKLHGLGNDFLVGNASEAGGPQRSLAALARKICDRHLGVGADGILYYQPTVGDRDAEFSTLIFNADGSRAEMSGNGVRCLAAFLYHTGQVSAKAVRIRTVAGVRTLTLKDQLGKVYTFEGSFGQPITDPLRIPGRFGGQSGPIVNFPLAVGSETVRISASSMGNPHCSTFWPELESAPVESLGPALENHASFPNRANVEFIQVVDRHRVRVRFWERGVGRTLASGTGSAAAVVAAILNDFAESPVTVETELGSLLVNWSPPAELFVTGPAEFICSGSYPNEADT